MRSFITLNFTSLLLFSIQYYINQMNSVGNKPWLWDSAVHLVVVIWQVNTSPLRLSWQNNTFFFKVSNDQHGRIVVGCGERYTKMYSITLGVVLDSFWNIDILPLCMTHFWLSINIATTTTGRVIQRGLARVRYHIILSIRLDWLHYSHYLV